ncbi:MAG: amino acid adenylation domain-containing protein [Tatlockia sp.]|nr:amino acid adenylation domain-containing protein [Tatlockia sp.]
MLSDKCNNNPDQKEFDLSIGQKELWFIHSMGGLAQSAYNESLIYSLSGYLSLNSLKKALATLIEQHAILRTSFIKDEEGNLLQKVHPSAPLDFQIVELQDETLISHYVKALISQPFDLEQASMMRVSLVKQTETNYLLIIVLHHIVTDGTSFTIFVEHLNRFYNQILSDEAPEPSANQAGFNAQVRLEQANFVSSDYFRQVDEVVEELRGYSGLNFLTTPIRQERVDIYSGNRVYFNLDKTLCEQINKFAQLNRATVFHFLFAAFSLMISQHTRSDDLVIGVPFANRESDPDKQTMGYFINTLPVRQTLNPKDNFSELIVKVKSLIFSYLCKQGVAFEHIAPKLNLMRKTSGQHPLIQTLFVWGSTDKLQLKFEGTNAELQQKYFSETSKFDLSLFLLEKNKQTIQGYFEYRDSLFDQELIEGFASGFKILLSNIVKNPQLPLSSISLLNDAEKQRMKDLFFRSKLDRVVTQALPELFSKTVASFPDKIGLVFANKRYNYVTIELISNRWATYIRHVYKESFGKELIGDTLIALCVDRSEDMIFGMLGILKAGAAYVPVDPHYPKDRIDYIINHSQASLLITQKSQVALNIDFAADRTIYMDDAAVAHSPHFVNKTVEHLISPQDLAYVLYTSGSTGKPKGVAVTHENVNCLFKSLDKQFELSDKDVWSLFHTFCFDISIWEIWGAFLYGGSLIVIPYETTRDSQQFYELVAAEKVTVLTQTASAFQMFINVDLSHDKKLDALRYIGFVGESLKVSILRPWVEKYGTDSPRLANLYGITETTVYTNYKFISQQDINRGRDNIGWPLEEFSMSILDQNNDWCAVGIVGEICIGGRGLSRGYLYRDDLTKEKFFPDPHASFLGLQKGALLYRTGDLGRWMADGSIEYLGRKDFQVKLRGFRIELGEIEAVLGSYEGISHTVVVLKGEGDFAYLAAYYTSKPQVHIETANLIAYLKSFLPDYMLPKTVVELPFFPMTVNGKIDRKVLEKYEDTLTPTKVLIPLCSELEVEIAKIWSFILKVPIENIGSSSNFFDLGGNSLLVVKMLTQVCQKFTIEFRLSHFIAVPTIFNLAFQADSNYDTSKTTQQFCKRLSQDIRLDTLIQPLKKINQDLLKPKNLLITGVTGFFGAHLLAELLETTPAKIYCLVRASSSEEGLKKIKTKQEKYKLFKEKHLARIVPIVGDLKQLKLGLTENDFEFLSKEIDSIFHVGAWVHHVYDYDTLYPANVLSVVEALKLAVHLKNKAVHFVSTLATNLISPIENLTKLNPDSIEAQLNCNGYLVSKWVAERLLNEARLRGIVAHVYRPGNIIAGKLSIYEPEDNHSLLRLKGMLQLGKGFINPHEKIEMMPVDLLARAIIAISLNPQLFSYNLNNSESISWIQYLKLAKKFGFNFEFLNDKDEWRKIIINLDESNALYTLSHFYNSETGADAETKDADLTIIPDYKIATASYDLMIEQQLTALIASGFLKQPQSLTIRSNHARSEFAV